MTHRVRETLFSRHPLLEYSVLLGILILAAYLRLHNVGDNPGWYSDEGTHLSIAHNLSQGRVQYLAVTESFLLFARLPLFEIVLSGFMTIFGSSMATLRGLTAALGVLSVGMLYYVVKRLEEANGLLALSAAFLLAIYPQAILYSRFGFSYNLLVPLGLLTCLGLAEYLRTGCKKPLLLAAGCVGIGLISDLIIGAFIVILLTITLYKNPKDILWSMPVAALPFALYALVMLLTVPAAFMFDLNYTLSRLGGLTLLQQIDNVLHNYTVLLSQDFWIPLGIIGLFLLPSPHLRVTSLLLFFGFILFTGRTAALYSLSAYYTIPILPFPALGVAALLYTAAPKVWRMVHTALDFIPQRTIRRGLTASAILLLMLMPFVATLRLMIQHTQTQFPTTIDPFLINPQDARQVAAYIQNHTEKDAVIIASPALAWMLNTRTADFQMSVAASGSAAVHLPGNLPESRFAFDPRFQSADYLIVDNMWRNWGVVHLPQVAYILEGLAEVEPVFQSGDLQVYRIQP